MLIGAATIPISHAGSLSRGVTLSLMLLVPVTGLWMGRNQFGWIASAEQTGVHRRLAKWLVLLAAPVWWLLLTLQVALFVFGMALVGLGPVEPALFEAGLVVLALAVTFRAMRIEWQKPRDPSVVDIDEVAALLGEEHLERRITRVLVYLTILTGAWAYVLEATV